MVSPAVESQARQHAGKLKVVKLNVDEAPQIAPRYGVQGIPLLVLVRDGQEVDRLVGAVPEAQIRELVERHPATAPG
jgi:thioredoxin 2